MSAVGDVTAAPAFLRKLKTIEHDVGFATPCPDGHASSGFSVLIRPDEAVGRWRFECVDAEPGDPCGTEGKLVELLGLEEAELELAPGPDGDTWRPLNLATLGERDPVQPTLGGVGLVYPGRRHLFSGPPESAKTLAAYIVGLKEIRAGGTVILIDFEMGRWDARERFLELGATADELASLLYVEPEKPADEATMLGLLKLAPTLAIIDATAGAYALQNLDDNKRADVEKWSRLYLHTFAAHGVGTLAIDHVVKNAENRGGFAIGSERKVGGVDVHLGFEPLGKKLTRGGRAFYRIMTHKDRPGFLPRPQAAVFELHSDPETHAISWTVTPPVTQQDADADGFRPTVLMERVSEYLERFGGPASRRQIEQDVKGKGTGKRQAMDKLVEEGYATAFDGARGARLLQHIRPYRQADDPLRRLEADE